MFNIEKAMNCTKKLKTYFNEIQEDANVEIPITIKKNSEEYFVYIFYSCLLDYVIRAKIYHNNLINTYKNYKEIFSPKYVVNNYINDKAKLLKIIKENIHPRYPNIALNKWIKLSIFLNDNPKLKENLTYFKSYESLHNYIRNIGGFGQKTGGLLIRLIYESGVCNFKEDIKDIPIDRPDIQISYLNGVISKEKLNKEEIRKLSKIWIEVAHKNDISSIDIDKYLWTIGNTLCSKKKCDSCPLKTTCFESKERVYKNE